MTDNVLCIIPARGGSKGVPHKNKRVVGGAPLISYTLHAAKEAKRVNRIVVSTDDEEIEQIAIEAGVRVVRRPEELATDLSPVVEAVRHACEDEKRAGFVAGAVVLLQPTSPFRSSDDIDKAVQLFFSRGMTPVCSVYRCEDNHPARMYTIEEGKLVSLMPSLSAVRRQDLPPVFHRNGAIYVFGKREILNGEIISGNMTPYVMDAASSINVDSEVELLLVDVLLERRRENPTA